MAQPTLYHNNRNRLNDSAKRTIVASWIFSFGIGIITSLGLISGDKFQIYPMGMTLSKKFDELYLYEALILAEIILLWLIYIVSRITINKKNKKSSIKKDGNSVKNATKAMISQVRNLILASSFCYLPLAIVQSFREHPTLNLVNTPQFSDKANTAWNVCMLVASRLVVLSSLLNCIIFNSHNKYVAQEKDMFFKKMKCNYKKKHFVRTETVQIHLKSDLMRSSDV